MHLVEIARSHIQRDYNHPKDLPLTPTSGKELIGYRRLVVRLTDLNKELQSEVRIDFPFLSLTIPFIVDSSQESRKYS